MIKINEYVYDVKYLNNSLAVQNDIDNLLLGTNKEITITGYTFNSTTFEYVTGETSTTTTLTRDEFPIDENNLPRQIKSSSLDAFFQKGAGWYRMTTNHRSSDILDNESSVLTGRTKTIKTKPKMFTFGEEYFDYFRKIPGLDYGFEIESRIDNKRGSVVSSDIE